MLSTRRRKTDRGRLDTIRKKKNLVLSLFFVAFVLVYALWVERESRNFDTYFVQDVEQTRHSSSLSQSSSETKSTTSVYDYNKNEKDSVVSVIGHVVSLIKCSRDPSGFMDAAAVLRYSIHRQHWPFRADSKYGYVTYALVHPDCAHHREVLQRHGYRVLVRPPAVVEVDIVEGWYRDHVGGENCCGAQEFLKLHAYNLTAHEVVVHWDMDVAVLRPLDDLYDAILFGHDTDVGREARQRLDILESHGDKPIDAFMTRDATSSQPWEPVQGVQGGFLMARTDPTALDQYIEFIRKGNYRPGRGRGAGTGWDSLGYGGFQGAMAYQGVVAYFYDVLRPKTAVDLDYCRFNQVAADVIWRGPDRNNTHYGVCRVNGDHACYDCRTKPSVDEVVTAHYTACKKPWECRMPYPRVPRDQRQKHRLANLVNVPYCLSLQHKWFALRRDLDLALGRTPPNPSTGLEPSTFLGYCPREGQYTKMDPLQKYIEYDHWQ